MINQIMPGVQNPLLAIAAKIREQISQQAMTPPQTSPPSAGAPEERDYTEGMERPELTAIKSEKEFKATPSRTTAFLVALGNILQDKQNLEAAKQQAAQGEYNAKLSDAMELNKLFKTGKIKREFDESDPDTQLSRKLKEQAYQQNEKLFPLKMQREQTNLDRLLKKGQGGGDRASGGNVGEQASTELPSGFAAIIAQNSSQYDPITKQPKPTPAEIETSYRQYLATNPATKDRVSAKEAYNSYKSEIEKQIDPEKVLGQKLANKQKELNIKRGEKALELMGEMDEIKRAKAYKELQRIDQDINVMNTFGTGGLAPARSPEEIMSELPPKPSAGVEPQKPSSRLDAYKKSRGLK